MHEGHRAPVGAQDLPETPPAAPPAASGVSESGTPGTASSTIVASPSRIAWHRGTTAASDGDARARR